MLREYLDVERADGVARVTMTRTDHHNSLNREMADELADAVIDLVADDDVRCLALTGAGGAFNTGADLAALEGDPNDGRRLRKLASRLHVSVRHLAEAPKPVVTGVGGVAAGGGLGLALCGDLVVASEDARFEFAYPRIGLSGDGGSTYFLPRLVGLRRALEFALRDEPVGGAEAAEIGLATEAVPADEFDDRLAEVAAGLADGPTRAYGATVRLLRSSESRSLGAQLTAETDQIARLAGTDDFAAGIAAFFGDEEPTFIGE
jgi:2-(1,2-epoxy-1,2-dihydrophenyl)acetyl-CoA isomerase